MVHPICQQKRFCEQELDIQASLKVKWSESRSVVSNSLRPHGLCSPWNSPGQNTGMGSLSLLQQIFPTQESNRGLLHCRQILYQLSYQGNPEEYNLSLIINKNHFYFLSPVSISLHFISLVSVGRGDKKINLSTLNQRLSKMGHRGFQLEPCWVSSPSLSSLSECHKGFTVVWAPPGNTYNHQDPSASYLSPGFSLNRVLVSEISICCGMAQNNVSYR